MLRLSRVTKSFGSLVAVDDLSLDIRPGEVFGLLGPNGAGKTTTVNLAVGVLRPDSGSVDIDGAGPPTDPTTRAKIGVAPQSLALYDDLSGDQNLRFFGKLYGLSGAHLRTRVSSSLEFVGLSARRRDRVKTYSGGMKRRLNLAVALLHEPKLLLMDEPTVGVDPQSRNAIFDNILELRRQGCTIVYTTHYMEEAERLCDRVGILDHGKLLALDAVPRLVEKYGGKSILRARNAGGTVSIETDDPITELVRLREEGDLMDFRVDRPDLERVFLSLTGRHLRD